MLFNHLEHPMTYKGNWLGLGRPKKNGDRAIGPTQLLVLQSIKGDPERAYAVGIAQDLEKQGKSITDGAIVTTLHRLERDRYIESVSQPLRCRNAPAKRGRPRKHYRITQSGLGVLCNLSGRQADQTANNSEMKKGFNNETSTFPPGAAPVV